MTFFWKQKFESEKSDLKTPHFEGHVPCEVELTKKKWNITSEAISFLFFNVSKTSNILMVTDHQNNMNTMEIVINKII